MPIVPRPPPPHGGVQWAPQRQCLPASEESSLSSQATGDSSPSLPIPVKGTSRLPVHQSPRTHPCLLSCPIAEHPVHPISRHFSDPLTSQHLGDPSHSQLRPGTHHLGQSPHHASEPTHSREHQWSLGNMRPQKRLSWGEAAVSESPDPDRSRLQAKNPNHKGNHPVSPSPGAEHSGGGTPWICSPPTLPPTLHPTPCWLFPDLSVPAPPKPLQVLQPSIFSSLLYRV